MSAGEHSSKSAGRAEYGDAPAFERALAENEAAKLGSRHEGSWLTVQYAARAAVLTAAVLMFGIAGAGIAALVEGFSQKNKTYVVAGIATLIIAALLAGHAAFKFSALGIDVTRGAVPHHVIDHSPAPAQGRISGHVIQNGPGESAHQRVAGHGAGGNASVRPPPEGSVGEGLPSSTGAPQ
jgi:hypothetical protein